MSSNRPLKIKPKTRIRSGIVSVGPPPYDPDMHIHEIASHDYYHNLLIIRDLVKHACDNYMREELGAINVDLFMLTTSVSSPMGPGSDSEPLPIKFGEHDAFLTDSSQFGFEPLLMNGFERVYCYLPSMRGEEPDARHLNQFFHCEAEIRGDLDTIILVVEQFVKHLASTLILRGLPFINEASMHPDVSRSALYDLATTGQFIRITFDDACQLLIDNGHKDCVNVTPHGRDINSHGEQIICTLLKTKLPIWITHFDRDRVPFYQKPVEKDIDKVLCADLIFPALVDGSFGGEIVGAGQRQNNPSEMYESLQRQGISSASYEWYIDLRKRENYSVSSGFGLGIERFLAWSLCLDRIRDAIIYPREKNVPAKP